MSSEALTGWGPSNSGISSCSDLTTNRFWILSQFLDEQMLSAENFSKSPDWILGDWWNFISQRGESEPVHYLPCPEDYKLATGVSAQLMRHVTPTNPSAALTTSIPGSRGGGRTCVLHLYRLNKHVHVRGEQDHWKGAPVMMSFLRRWSGNTSASEVTVKVKQP